MTNPLSQQLAQVTAELATLKRDRVTEKLATVTAVDEASSTFTATVPGAVDPMDGIAAPAQFLPAVGDIVRLRLVGAVPIYQPERLAGGSGADALGLYRPDRTLHTRIDENGQAVFSELETIGADPVFGGTPLSQTLSAYSEATSSWGRATTSGPAVTTTELGYMEHIVTLRKGRRYTIATSGFFIDASASPQQFEVRLRYTMADGETTPAAPTITSTMLDRSFADVASTNAVTKAPPIQSQLVTSPGTGVETYRFLISLFRVVGAGSAYIRANALDPVDIWYTDNGPAVAHTMTAAGTTTPKTYVLTRYSTWGATWRENGVKRPDTNNVYQGRGPSPNLNQTGAFGFDSVTPELTGATVTRVRVYLNVLAWAPNDGGTAIVGVHGHLSEPTTFTLGQLDLVRQAWSTKTGAKWIDLPSTHFAGWVSGSYRGIAVGPGPTDSTEYYGYYEPGGVTRLEITYTK